MANDNAFNPDDDKFLLPLPHPNADFNRRSRDRDNEAARLKAMGWTLEEIANHLPLGGDPRRAAAAIRRALVEVVRFGSDELRLMESRSLDQLEWQAWKTLQEEHVVISQGRIVYGEDGMPIKDDRFVLEVIDRILKIKERRAKLLGLDAPTRSEVLTIDSIEAEIAKLEREVRGGSQL